MSQAIFPTLEIQIEHRAAEAVRTGLECEHKWLPPWLFYDTAGSQLFERITELPEYYLTRTERGILSAHASQMIAAATEGGRLRVVELGAGSAEKTRLLLKAAVKRQGSVAYEPIDVSASALQIARERIEREIEGVCVTPQVADYTGGLVLEAAKSGERRLVVYIGSSIGNFEPREALEILRRIRAGLKSGDGLLLGVDLVKDEATLVAAYDDAAGVTAAFNRNVLARLNRDLGGGFDLKAFAHRAVWNQEESRMEMHLESRAAQRVRLAALNMEVEFEAGERIHTENSYKYRPGQAEAMLAKAGFKPVAHWMDKQQWFAVHLGRAGA